MTSLESWPTETEAAAQLGTSAKTIARYASQGKIEVRKRPRPGKKPENICNPRDVDRLRPVAHVMPDTGTQDDALSDEFVEGAKNVLALRPKPQPETAAFLDFIRTIATAIETQRRIVQMPTLWLTLKEAAELSGLSKNYLKRMIESTKLQAVRDRRGWRIRRAALEAFEG
jgi:excisionase family DNA binding protein